MELLPLREVPREMTARVKSSIKGNRTKYFINEFIGG